MPPANKPKMPRCAIYCRSAVDRLYGQPSNWNSQLRVCQEFIRRRRTWEWRTNSHAYIDRGFSGMSINRPALRRLLADASKGKFEVLVCDRIHRIGRNAEHVIQLLNMLGKHGVSVYTCA